MIIFMPISDDVRIGLHFVVWCLEYACWVWALIEWVWDLTGFSEARIGGFWIFWLVFWTLLMFGLGWWVWGDRKWGGPNFFNFGLIDGWDGCGEYSSFVDFKFEGWFERWKVFWICWMMESRVGCTSVLSLREMGCSLNFACSNSYWSWVYWPIF